MAARVGAGAPTDIAARMAACGEADTGGEAATGGQAVTGGQAATGGHVEVASQSSPTQSPGGEEARVDLSRHSLLALPTDVCARLSAVRALLLSQNFIGRLPAVAWSSFGELRDLDLSDNCVASLPSDGLCSLRSLRVLRLARQRGPKGERLLTELPDALGALPRLEELDVSGNALTELPAGLADGALRALHAADNPLLLRLHDEAGERLFSETEVLACQSAGRWLVPTLPTHRAHGLHMH